MELEVCFLTVSYIVADYFKIYISKYKPLKKFFHSFSFSVPYTYCSSVVKNN